MGKLPQIAAAYLKNDVLVAFDIIVHIFFKKIEELRGQFCKPGICKKGVIGNTNRRGIINEERVIGPHADTPAHTYIVVEPSRFEVRHGQTGVELHGAGICGGFDVPAHVGAGKRSPLIAQAHPVIERKFHHASVVELVGAKPENDPRIAGGNRLSRVKMMCGVEAALQEKYEQ